MKTIAVLLIAALPAFAAESLVCDGQTHDRVEVVGGTTYTCTHMQEGVWLDSWVDGAGKAVGDRLPVVDTDSPVLAPDQPNVSVRLRAGETAPFDGRLLSLDENLRRGKKTADCEAELADGKTNVWTSKPVLIALIVGGVALGAAAGAGVTAWALKK